MIMDSQPLLQKEDNLTNDTTNNNNQKQTNLNTEWARKMEDKKAKFMKACTNGDEHFIDAILKDPLPMEGLVDVLKTSLNLALFNKHFGILNKFLGFLFPSNEIDKSGSLSPEQREAFPYIVALNDAKKLGEILEKCSENVLDFKAFFDRNMISLLAHIENTNVIEKVLSYFDEKSLFLTAIQETDKYGGNVFHWACFLTNSILIREIAKAITNKNINLDRTLIIKTNKKGKTPIYLACKCGLDLDSFKWLLGSQNDIERDLTFCDNELTDCEPQEKHSKSADNCNRLRTKILRVSSTEEIERAKWLINIVKEDDKKEHKTALYYACTEGHDELVMELLIQYAKALDIVSGGAQENTRIRTEKDWEDFLQTKVEKEHRPFQSADRYLLERLLESIDIAKDWTKIRKIPWITILAQENKLGFSAFEYSSNAETIVSIMEKLRKDNVHHDKRFYECFPEFALPVKQTKNYTDLHGTHPLAKIGKSNNLLLLKHPYVRDYVDTCWQCWVKHFFYTYVCFYFLFFIALCCYVSSHKFTTQHGASRNESELKDSAHMVRNVVYPEYSFSRPWSYLTVSTSCVTVVLAMLGLAYETVQMYNMRRYYFKSGENYADLVLFPGALAITIIPMVTGYKSWTHGLGCVLIIMCAYRSTLLLTHVPIFGSRFRMLKVGVQNVAFFSPVLFFFTASFAIVFHNLLQNKEAFSHMGFAFMKVIAMSIGELEFGDTFLDDSHHEPFMIVSFLLLLALLGIITISMMNLLVGIAVGNIENLHRQGQKWAFISKVEHIFHVFYIFKLGKWVYKQKLGEIRGEKSDTHSKKEDDHNKKIQKENEKDEEGMEMLLNTAVNRVKQEVNETWMEKIMDSQKEVGELFESSFQTLETSILSENLTAANRKIKDILSDHQQMLNDMFSAQKQFSQQLIHEIRESRDENVLEQSKHISAVENLVHIKLKNMTEELAYIRKENTELKDNICKLVEMVKERKH